MVEREPGVPEERRIRFRMGINLGDVIVEDDDIFGDGVNIAARLEDWPSRAASASRERSATRSATGCPSAFEDMGEQSVKNIARPVRVYALRPEGIADVPMSKRVAGHFTFAAPRCATPVDRGPTLHKPQRRSGAAVFCGRDHRGSHDRSVAARAHVRDLVQYRVHLSEQAGRHEANRSRVGRALCARRQRQAIGQPGPRQHSADRRRDRRTSVGPSGSTATRAICLLCRTRSRASSRTPLVSS